MMLNRVFLKLVRWPVWVVDAVIIMWLGSRLSELIATQYPKTDQPVINGLDVSQIVGTGVVLVLFIGMVGGWYAILTPKDDPADVAVSDIGRKLIRWVCIALLPLAVLFEFAVTYWAIQDQATNPFAQGPTPSHELTGQWLQALFLTLAHLAAGGVTAIGFLLDIQDESEAAAIEELDGFDPDIIHLEHREKSEERENND